MSELQNSNNRKKKTSNNNRFASRRSRKKNTEQTKLRVGPQHVLLRNDC